MIEPTLAREGMRYWRLQPDARLRPWILCYWMVEPDPETATAPSASETDPEKLQLLIPDGHSEIVFRFAGSFTRWNIDQPDVRTEMCASYVIGGRSKSVFTRSIGGLRLAGMKLDPRALRALIGMPLTEFRDNTVACGDLGVTALSDLEDEVANVRTVDQLVSVLDRFFSRRLTNEVGRTLQLRICSSGFVRRAARNRSCSGRVSSASIRGPSNGVSSHAWA